MKSLRRMLVMVTAIAVTINSQAGVLNLTYKPPTADQIEWFGSKKADSYDVAVFVSNPSLMGKTVTGIRVPLDAPDVQNVKTWLSTELTLENKKINPDILCQGVNVADGFIDVTFSNPYTITDKGFYAGYSFEITSTDNGNDKTPVATYVGQDQPGALWMHTTKKYMSWTDVAKSQQRVSAIIVKISGMPDFAAAIEETNKVYVPVNTSIQHEVIVSNHGCQPVNSVKYECEINGKKGTGEITLSTPLSPTFFTSAPLTVTLPGIQESGDYKAKITVTSVNGQPNGDIVPSCELDVCVVPFVPVNRPVMEEYTGLWCGYCPKGFACMQQMNELYGSDFIAISYHDNDVLQYKELPDYVGGLPAGDVNRRAHDSHLDPTFANVNPIWQQLRQEFAIAEITPTATWRDTATIDVNCDVRFVSSMTDTDYRLAYVLVENGLTDPNWYQSNYFSNDQTYADDPYMLQFVEAPSKMTGLVYDDVAIYSPDFNGIPASIKSDFKASEVMSHSIVIERSKVLSVDEEPLILNPDQLFIVAMLIDAKTGAVVNSNRCAVTGWSGIETVASEDSMATWYDLMGRQVSPEDHGVFIKCQGTSVQKVMR